MDTKIFKHIPLGTQRNHHSLDRAVGMNTMSAQWIMVIRSVSVAIITTAWQSPRIMNATTRIFTAVIKQRRYNLCRLTIRPVGHPAPPSAQSGQYWPRGCRNSNDLLAGVTVYVFILTPPGWLPPVADKEDGYAVRLLLGADIVLIVVKKRWPKAVMGILYLCSNGYLLRCLLGILHRHMSKSPLLSCLLNNNRVIAATVARR